MINSDSQKNNDCLRFNLIPLIKSLNTFNDLSRRSLPMQYNIAVRLVPVGIRHSKNRGKYVEALLMPTNIMNQTMGILSIKKNKLREKK